MKRGITKARRYITTSKDLASNANVIGEGLFGHSRAITKRPPCRGQGEGALGGANVNARISAMDITLKRPDMADKGTG